MNWRGFLCMVAFLFAMPTAYGVNLNAVYYASCKREVGVIINSTEDTIAILALDGVIKKVKRYDIIYLAQYPVGEVPIQQVTNADLVDGIVIRTLFQNELVELVKGWPVNFSEEKIAFLSLDGQETIIDRDSIWEVNSAPFEKNQKFSTKAKTAYEFVHPYPFSDCPAEKDGQDSKQIFPQQLLGDRLIIKNELDRLKEGYEKVADYGKDQKFYPVPQIYDNKTTLGLWYNYGSRHGKSTKRSNNFVPAIVSTLSEGPFGFQRTLVTGAAPLPMSVHEEPQTQFYYRLKADYVHFSYFFDIDRVLIGEEPYKWRIDDLDKYDDRINEVHHLSGGFDYGNYAAGLSLSTIQYGVRHEDSFFVHRADAFMYDFTYEDRLFSAQLIFANTTDTKGGGPGGKRGGDEEPDENEPDEVRAAREALEREEDLKPDFLAKMQFYRTNFRFKHLYLEPHISLIYRGLRFYHQEDRHQENELTYASKSFTGAVYLNYQYDDDIGFKGYVSVESRKNRSGISTYEEESSENFPKAGLNWFLSF
jgi:hypothetical protein